MEKKWNSENYTQKALRFFWKNNEEVKNVLTKRYGPSRKRNEKAKNVLKKRSYWDNTGLAT